MTPFLEQQARVILKTVTYDIDYEHKIILPNRRSCQFLNRHLKEQAEKTGFIGILPQSYTFDELAGAITGLQGADGILLSYILYKHFRINFQAGEDFVKFSSWCNILLSDFNDIHLELADYKILFVNAYDDARVQLQFADFLTEEEKQIILKLWQDFDNGQRSQYLERFIELWQILPSILAGFDQELLLDGLAYPGLMLRKANELVGEYISENALTKCHFIGFHTLSKSYASLIEHFLSAGLATVAWDTNSELFKDPETQDFHEANAYKKRIKGYPLLHGTLQAHLKGTLEPSCKKITLLKANTTNSSIRAIPEILQSFALEGGADWYEHVLICLCNPELLEPLLSKLLQDKSFPINISIGINLSSTAIKPLVAQLRRIHIQSLKSGTANQVFLPDLLTLLENPYIVSSASSEIKAFQADRGNLGSLYVNQSLLQNVLPTLSTVLDILYSTASLNKKLAAMLTFLLEAIKSSSNEVQSLRHLTIKKAVSELNRIESLNQYRQSLEIDDVFDLFEGSLSQFKIQFAGEPLVGLQVVGMLETRNLDYKHVIIVGANEGSLPPSRHKPSLIPASLKKAFKLPSIDDETGIYSYLFYRFFNYCQSMHILYDEAGGDTSHGEKSRFITQVQFIPAFSVEVKQVNNLTMVRTGSQPITIEKSPAIMHELSRYLISSETSRAKKLYPSSILTYLECPIRFYFKFIACIEEEEQLSGEVDASVFGNIIHNTLEYMYTDLKNQVGQTQITADILEGYAEQLDSYINKATLAALGLVSTNKVANDNITLIATRVAKRFVQKVIAYDKTHPFYLIATEQRAEHNLLMPVRIEGSDDFVQVQGKMDRVDRVNGVIRIVDYKTGKVENLISTIPNLFTDKKVNKEALQILLYALLYQKSLPAPEPVKPMVFGLRKANAVHSDDDHFTYIIKETGQQIEDIRPYAQALEDGYGKVLQSLFDKDTPFTQTDHKDRCTYCTYAGICKR